MLGKIICGALHCPSLYPSTTSEEEMIRNGYKKVVYDAEEENREGFVAVQVLHETEHEIHISYDYVETPECEMHEE